MSFAEDRFNELLINPNVLQSGFSQDFVTGRAIGAVVIANFGEDSTTTPQLVDLVLASGHFEGDVEVRRPSDVRVLDGPGGSAMIVVPEGGLRPFDDGNRVLVYDGLAAFPQPLEQPEPPPPPTTE